MLLHNDFFPRRLDNGLVKEMNAYDFTKKTILKPGTT